MILHIDNLKTKLDIPLSLKEIIGEDKKEDYMSNVDIIAEEAFDDQCTGSNPRYPLIKDLKQILINAWEKIELKNNYWFIFTIYNAILKYFLINYFFLYYSK